MKRWLVGIALVLVLGAGIWVRLTYLHYFPLVPDEIGAPAATPPVLGAFGGDPAVVDVAGWERRRPLLLQAFAENVYGAMPPALPSTVLARTALDASRAGDGARLEQLTVGFGEAGARGKVNVVLALPPTGTPVRGLIVMQTFCGNALAMGKLEGVRSLTPPPEMCDGPMTPIAHIILGKWANGPPLKRILPRGYAVAIVYAADLVPDEDGAAQAALARLYGPDFKGPEPGALAAWAWLYAEVGEVLTREPGLHGAPVIAWGHSRNGKAALLAGAVYPNVAGVIAHQSGRGGAPLNRSAVGESIKQITGAYGFWFTPRYASFAGREAEMPVDQHQLLALSAPKPVLLGAGGRDLWSDPAGAFRSAQGAAPVWQLYGRPGFDQPALTKPDLTRPLASFMRPGTHGVTTQDWDNFLTWLDANFPARAAVLRSTSTEEAR